MFISEDTFSGVVRTEEVRQLEDLDVPSRKGIHGRSTAFPAYKARRE
jgi:hypothetical protein